MHCVSQLFLRSKLNYLCLCPLNPFSLLNSFSLLPNIYSCLIKIRMHLGKQWTGNVLGRDHSSDCRRVQTRNVACPFPPQMQSESPNSSSFVFCSNFQHLQSSYSKMHFSSSSHHCLWDLALPKWVVAFPTCDFT